ncbi:MAG: SIR2 family NAD-dependent protein deacylase [Desertimonas sp.]
MKPNLVVLSGAGVSAESGIAVMTDATTWRNVQIHDIASQASWERDPQLLIDFFNDRRREFATKQPNDAHRVIRDLETDYDVTVITTNVDDLHERAGSRRVIHLHGDIRMVQSSVDPRRVYEWDGDLEVGDVGPDGVQLRPNVVFFGEAIPMLDSAVQACRDADVMIIVGTSMQVYPAAVLYTFAPPDCRIFVVDPAPPEISGDQQVEYISDRAVTGMRELRDRL